MKLFTILLFLLIFITHLAGCVGYHTMSVAQYKHLYTATEERIKINKISANLNRGELVVGRITGLDFPEADTIWGRTELFHGYCHLRIYFQNEDESTIEAKTITIFFTYPRLPADYEVSEDDIILVKMGLRIQDRKYRNWFRAAYVRNLTKDWRRYKLPLTNK